MSDKLKEKIGDWLLDIAKYLITVVALSSVFQGLAQPMAGILGVLIAIVVLVVGIIS